MLDISIICTNKVVLHFRVHVRRTDKVGTEAAFHGIEEYMMAVDDYYNQVEMTEAIDKRRVFIASDDPKVKKYTTNKFYLVYIRGRKLTQSKQDRLYALHLNFPSTHP